MNIKTNDRYLKLKKIKDEIVNLKVSPLYDYRVKNKYHPVIGEGSHYAHIMFVGEAPGETEAIKARPFCGAAGRILDELLESINVKREDVYITNVVKDRPPGNRDPQPSEIELYSPFLYRQIQIIKPKVIATLGRFSMSYIMNKFGLFDKLESISKIHGKIFETNAEYGQIKIIPLYHPAVALYSGGMKKSLVEDFKILKQFV